MRDEAEYKGDGEAVGIGTRRGRDAEGVSVVKERPRIPLWRWGLWWFLLGVGMFLFYVLLTPIWIGLRVLAWIAEFRARRQKP